ncbi:hypothetical protein N7523_008069 [Penicillium sp. IBT 18751x]|nr:hypothetical protein N7523_008069 [Penicillium sp. IBT 18751x]
MLNRSIRIIGSIAIPTAAITHGIQRGLCHLEAEYPELPETGRTSNLLLTPDKPTQRVAYTDIFAARIPLNELASLAPTPSQTDLEIAWARAVLNTPILRLEGSLVGLLIKHTLTPGDTGNTKSGFSPKNGSPRGLLNGVLTVQREPGIDRDSNGLLISWKIPAEPRLFFEKIARWGYPWRLMSGGRHEMSVSQPIIVPDQDAYVEVRFAASHDYEVVIGEVVQKVVPAWTLRLHKGYARFILDQAVKEVMKASNEV